MQTWWLSLVILSFLLLCPQVNSLPAERIQEIQKAIELFSVGQGPAKTMEEASKRSYQFWDTQPVPKLGMCSPAALSAPWQKLCGAQAARTIPKQLTCAQQALTCCPGCPSKAPVVLVHLQHHGQACCQRAVQAAGRA